MNGFVYFVADATPGTAVRDGALEYAFDGRQPVTRECLRGPGDRKGVLLGLCPPAELDYEPAGQTWMEIPGRPGVWIGHATGSPPAPADLQRGEIIAGYPAALEGGSWIVPLARIYPAGSNLPESLAVGPDGALVRKTVGRYLAASRAAERLWDQVRAAHGLEGPDETIAALDDLEAFQTACMILGLNYRVGEAELGLLGALTTKNIARVLYLFVDMPAFMAAREDAAKKEAASPTDAAETIETPACSTPAVD